jgi:BirA family biotin operon repressor/biotin-[acetyl-CoA-carboxylase] ligase
VSGDLSQASLEAELHGRFGTPVHFLESTTSTNADALVWAHEGAPEGAVVVAEHQTHGRGRWGRAWVSEPGALLQFSLILRPSFPLDRMGLLTTALGLATAEGVEDVTGIKTGLKWPNDVTVVDRKLAGVLVESRMLGNTIDAAIAGVGINVGWAANAVPVGISDRATSIAIWTEDAVARPPLLAAVLARFEIHYDALTRSAGESVVEAASKRSVVLGRDVLARFVDGSFVEGRAVALSPTGALEIVSDGATRVLNVGEIEQLR